MVVEHNQLIDGLEKLGEGVLEPHLQLSFLQWFGLGSVGDLLKSWPEDSLQHHLPKLIFEEFSVLKEDAEEAFYGRLLHVGPAVSADREDDAQ